MQTTANITRFITGNSSRSGFADLKSLINVRESFQKIILNGFAQAENSKKIFSILTKRFIDLAQDAHTRRDLDTLEEASSVLINLPLAEANQTGLYYQALAKYGRGEKAEAQAQVEKTADNAPLIFRARSLHTLAAYHHHQGHLDESLKFNLEAIRLAVSEECQSLLVTFGASLNICFLLSEYGNNQKALAKLESLWPMAPAMAKESPLYYYFYHNALAVELAEAGRFDEAQAAIGVALASPFAPAYPEWSETNKEIAQKRDSKWSNLPASPQSLLETELNSISNRDSQTATALEVAAEAESQAVQVRAVKYRRAVIFYFSIRRYNFQITSDSVPAKSAAVNLGYAQSIIVRLGDSIRPRSPPCFS